MIGLNLHPRASAHPAPVQFPLEDRKPDVRRNRTSSPRRNLAPRRRLPAIRLRRLDQRPLQDPNRLMIVAAAIGSPYRSTSAVRGRRPKSRSVNTHKSCTSLITSSSVPLQNRVVFSPAASSPLRSVPN